MRPGPLACSKRNPSATTRLSSRPQPPMSKVSDPHRRGCRRVPFRAVKQQVYNQRIRHIGHRELTSAPRSRSNSSRDRADWVKPKYKLIKSGGGESLRALGFTLLQHARRTGADECTHGHRKGLDFRGVVRGCASESKVAHRFYKSGAARLRPAK